MKTITMTATLLSFSLLLSTGSLQAGEQLDKKALLSAIQQGGYVIYMRHSKTDKAQKDQNTQDLSQCQLQRNLSAEGKTQAQVIGKAIRQLNIPVAGVLSSPYCRAKDTAQLAFGDYQTEPNLRHLSGVADTDKAAVINALKSLLQQPPQAGSNTVLVSHSPNLVEASGIVPEQPGGMNIFAPKDEAFEYMGTIDPQDWTLLLND